MGPIFLILVVAAVLVGFATSRLEPLSQATLDNAGQAFQIALGLIGVMTFWLGLVEVLKRGGLMESLARWLRPLFRKLFPEIPDGHPALSAMTLNIAANMIGLTNSATPFGIEAMRQLDRLNGKKGTATNAMILFLAINTSGVALFPTGVMAVRAKLGSHEPAGIWIPTLLATSMSTLVAILAAKLLAGSRRFKADAPPTSSEASDIAPSSDPASPQEGSRVRLFIAWALFAAAIVFAGFSLFRALQGEGLAVAGRNAVNFVPLPLLILSIVLYGWVRNVQVYEAIVEGGKEGFQVAIRITPYMVAILVAVGMFRASGSLDFLTDLIKPLTSMLGFPAEALPMALVRPLSGSGALAVMTEAMQTHGPDSAIGYLVSTLQGSFETTFYVLAVYGGAVGLRRTRYAIPACLLGDLAGIIGATLACKLLGP